MRVAVANLKGGTGKTTTAVFLAHALARQGTVLLADADPQGSALSWSETAGELPFPVIALPVKNIHRELASVAAPYDHLVVDTPPGHPSLVGAALRAVDLILVPVQPSVLDVDRLQATLDLIEEARAFNNALHARLVLTRVRWGTRSLRDVRAILVEDGLIVLDTEIPQREAIALAGGSVVTDLRDYAPLVAELLQVA